MTSCTSPRSGMRLILWDTVNSWKRTPQSFLGSCHSGREHNTGGKTLALIHNVAGVSERIKRACRKLSSHRTAIKYRRTVFFHQSHNCWVNKTARKPSDPFDLVRKFSPSFFDTLVLHACMEERSQSRLGRCKGQSVWRALCQQEGLGSLMINRNTPQTWTVDFN